MAASIGLQYNVSMSTSRRGTGKKGDVGMGGRKKGKGGDVRKKGEGEDMGCGRKKGELC